MPSHPCFVQGLALSLRGMKEARNRCPRASDFKAIIQRSNPEIPVTCRETREIRSILFRLSSAPLLRSISGVWGQNHRSRRVGICLLPPSPKSDGLLQLTHETRQRERLVAIPGTLGFCAWDPSPRVSVAALLSNSDVNVGQSKRCQAKAG